MANTYFSITARGMAWQWQTWYFLGKLFSVYSMCIQRVGVIINNILSYTNEIDEIVHIRIKKGKEEYNILTVYNVSQDKGIGEKIRKIIENCKYQGILIGGDFNIRIGELRGEEGEGGIGRNSKDKIIGNGGEKFVRILKEEGLSILNGKTNGDWEGEYTYIGSRGCTVIDYIILYFLSGIFPKPKSKVLITL